MNKEINYEEDIFSTGNDIISIKLDNKYCFREIPYNYVISEIMDYTDTNGNKLKKYDNVGYYPNALGAINHYIQHCRSKKTPITTVEELKKEFEKRENNVNQLFEPISKAKRDYELTNELLVEDNTSLQKQVNTLNIKLKKLKEELKKGVK